MPDILKLIEDVVYSSDITSRTKIIDPIVIQKIGFAISGHDITIKVIDWRIGRKRD